MLFIDIEKTYDFVDRQEPRRIGIEKKKMLILRKYMWAIETK